MAALISLLVTIALSLLITRIASVALTMTGLSRDVARLQARSAFTGVGFTTAEAEKVVNNPVRRRILMLLMLLGNAGVVTAISSLVLTFVGTTDVQGKLVRLGLIILGIGLIWVLSASRWLNRSLSRLINWALNRWTRLNIRDYASLLQLSQDYRVSELQIEQQDWLANKSLSDVNLTDEGVLVLGIHRKDGSYIGAPVGETCIRPGDTIILYGRHDILENLDLRRADITGEMAHQNAIAQQKQVVSEQNRQDTESNLSQD